MLVLRLGVLDLTNQALFNPDLELIRQTDQATDQATDQVVNQRNLVVEVLNLVLVVGLYKIKRFNQGVTIVEQKNNLQPF